MYEALEQKIDELRGLLEELRTKSEPPKEPAPKPEPPPPKPPPNPEPPPPAAAPAPSVPSDAASEAPGPASWIWTR